MTFLELSPKLSKLFCELKLDHIKKKYQSIDKKYYQIDELFDLPETKERNAGILTSYSKLFKEAKELYQVLDHADLQVKKYEINLRVRLGLSAFSKKICEKNLDKIVDTEWTKDIGTLAMYSEEVAKLRTEFLNYRQRVNVTLGTLKLGMGCMEESLKKEKKTFVKYMLSLGEKKRELEYLAKNESKLRQDFFNANVESLKTSLANINMSLEPQIHHIRSLTCWLNLKLGNSKSSKKTEELEKKITLTYELIYKYTNLKQENERMLKSKLLNERPYLIFKN